MFSKQIFKEMCKMTAEGKAYYRPILCKGPLNKVDIFFVGTNPATPIYPKDMDLDTYIELLLDYEKFIEYYKKSRIRSDKGKFSRTRIGMNSFIEWLSSNTDASIAETEVVPYPTENLKQLKKEPTYIIDRGKEIFYQLVMEFTPKLIIIHGKDTVEHFIDIFSERGIIPADIVDTDETIDNLEMKLPLLKLPYPNGKFAIVMACRHFMYYGSKGESFKQFRENILSLLKNY
ncbi:hypothetical protein HNQ80_001164 [Anaerosolibacter carboniphilus]|uniref:Uracil DNA glycosylase superfamily protein n=1 Tax=Anaerosolibacter carboniphilus TaxID=1417629 RepID=A0A841KY67_9FIRM|nr:hypothetical protein [Anaerosolibacter carboniphilus]MBB6215075.1 hypothetical protein [Anaerosolibacter carboniphilus]